MKLSVSNKNLFGALARVSPAISPRATLPILSHVLLRAHEAGGLTLEASDLDVHASDTIDAAVAQPGSVALPARKLAAIVKETGDTVEIELLTNGKVRMKSGTSDFSLLMLEGQEFPEAPVTNDASCRFIMPQKTLKLMLRNTSYAASTDETRYILNGVYFDVGEAKLTLACSDGRRLALDTADFGEGSKPLPHSFIIPNKPVRHIERLLQDSSEPVEIAASKSSVLVKTKDWSVTAKLMEGEFPKFANIIPQHSLKLEVNREQLAAAVRRASLIGGISVKLSIGSNIISMRCDAAALGESQEQIAVQYIGNPIEVAFDPVFILGALNAMQGDAVTLELGDGKSEPALIRANGTNALCVIMPMRG